MGTPDKTARFSDATCRYSPYSGTGRIVGLEVFGDDRGTTAIEYALIAGGVALVIVSAVSAVGSSVLALFQAVKF
ncbi:MAG: Flp family type IVb pilin [Rhizomicrobium sp.]